ncbi:hypothetical protein EJB05_35611, partial [Eragrostis curvula]
MRERDQVLGTCPYFRTAEILALSSLPTASTGGAAACPPALLHARSERRSISGEAVDVSKALFRFANEVVCRVVSGRGCPESREEESIRRRRGASCSGSRSRSKVFTWVGSAWGLLPGAGLWADEVVSGGGARAWKNFRARDVLLEKHEALCREDGVEEKDFVDVLARAAARESTTGSSSPGTPSRRSWLTWTHTSFIVLEWAMSQLVKYPTAMRGALR